MHKMMICYLIDKQYPAPFEWFQLNRNHLLVGIILEEISMLELLRLFIILLDHFPKITFKIHFIHYLLRCLIVYLLCQLPSFKLLIFVLILLSILYLPILFCSFYIHWYFNISIFLTYYFCLECLFTDPFPIFIILQIK